METPAPEKNNLIPSRIEPLADEASALLSQLPDVKPGIQTTEFWLIAAVSLAILALAACGQIDGTMAGLIVSALAGWYQKERLNHKDDVRADHIDALTNAKPANVKSVADVPPAAQS